MSEESPGGTKLRIGKVRGVTLTKWQRVWDERFDAPLSVTDVADDDQLTGLRGGGLDMCFVRSPVDTEGLHAIPLYEEQMVAWVSKEHAISAVDEVTLADLEDEQVVTELRAGATDLALGGAVLVVPMSVARSASRRDLVYRPIVDADPSPIALAWRIDDDNPLIQEFIGVVRGRTPNSSRATQNRPAPDTRRTPERGRRAPEPAGRRTPAARKRRGR